jgi:hypothetical protein
MRNKRTGDNENQDYSRTNSNNPFNIIAMQIRLLGAFIEYFQNIDGHRNVTLQDVEIQLLDVIQTQASTVVEDRASGAKHNQGPSSIVFEDRSSGVKRNQGPSSTVVEGRSSGVKRNQTRSCNVKEIQESIVEFDYKIDKDNKKR